ncbi:MAG: lytic transglycosylase domain-containing protein [Elusimicrobia bacterium]|nr:lytic transglycosylase domain-containing protein [Elusimicrobiota bacterium]
MKILKILAIILILCLAVVSCNMFLNIKRAIKYYPKIEQYSKQYKVDPLLVVSIMKVESNFKPNAKSKKGAIGLMQVMPQTAKDVAGKYLNLGSFSEEKLYEPEYNIMVGIYYIKILSDMFDGNINLVLASYNAGLGNVQKWRIENPIIEYDPDEVPFKETKKYVAKISKIYEQLKAFKD